MNYKLTIQYDGTEFAGWQIQPNAPTVQQKIVDAIEILTKEKINLIGSGRTDTGVHSLGQVANFRIDRELDIFKFQHSLNAILPQAIAITKMQIVKEEFHARFDAVKRSYIYLFNFTKSPFYFRYSSHLPRFDNLNIRELNNAGRLLLGQHDFTSFSKKNSDTQNKVCTIYDIHWRRSGELLICYIEADRFLHGMVRTIVGTIKKAVEDNLNHKSILSVLNKKDRSAAGESAPPQGLFLFKVKYQ